jgi:hypothetical protein
MAVLRLAATAPCFPYQLDSHLLEEAAGVTAPVPLAKGQTANSNTRSDQRGRSGTGKSGVAKDQAQLPHKDLHIILSQFGDGDEDMGEARALVRLILWTMVLLGGVASVVYSLGHFIFRR